MADVADDDANAVVVAECQEVGGLEEFIMSGRGR
jgi:hypothetical protein